MTEPEVLNVKERLKLITTCNKKNLTFLHTTYGPDTYSIIKTQIREDKLSVPTMAETASLVYSAFNLNNKFSHEIIDVMEHKWLWTFTGTLFTPKGAYIQDDPEIRKEMPYMEESDLINRLENNDPAVRFVPFGYKTKEMSSYDFAKNKYVIGLAGEEGAEKLAEVADKYNDWPYLWCYKSVSKSVTKVSLLGADWFKGRKLYVGNLDHEFVKFACAFGKTK